MKINSILNSRSFKNILGLAVLLGGSIFLFFVSDLSFGQFFNFKGIQNNHGSIIYDRDRSYEFRIEVEPEFLAALNSAVPKNVLFKKVRYKKVPLKSLTVNGELLEGNYFMRYRGFSYTHWGYDQKTIKLQADRKSSILGYRTINLNSLQSDIPFFDFFTSRLAKEMGVMSPQTRLAQVYINGKYDGVVFMTENLDIDMINNNGLTKGAIYRERRFAKLGQKHSMETIKNVWKKNALKNASWIDLYQFNDSIYRSVMHRSEEYLDHINLDSYINYLAIVAIGGSTHLSDHNIPIYRPRNSSKFIPIIYDASGPSTGHYNHLSVLQVPYAPQNRLAKLLWSKFDFRIKLHNRIAQVLNWSGEKDISDIYNEIKNETDPDLNIAAAHGKLVQEKSPTFGAYKKFDSAQEFWENSAYPDIMKTRINAFRQSYFSPVVRFTPNWKKRSRFQIAIEGAGIYKVQLMLSKTLRGRKTKAPITVRVHDKVPFTVAWEDKNDLVSRPFFAERNDILSPNPKSPYSYWPSYNSMGAILIEVSNPEKLPIEKFLFTPMHSGAHIKVFENWPFDIRLLSPGVINLATNGNMPKKINNIRSRKDGYTTFRLPPPIYGKDESLDFKIKNGKLVISDWTAPGIGKESYYMAPIFCWRIEDREGCFEFTRAFTYPRGVGIPQRADKSEKKGFNTQVKFLDSSQIKKGKNFTFTKKEYWIKKPLVFDHDSSVTFESGSKLLFAPQAYLLIKGAVNFQGSGEPIEFRAIKDEWGGVAIVGKGKEVAVRNAVFIGSNEFFAEGKRYTGALNIYDKSKAEVSNCTFIDNDGDDAINIKGGDSNIKSNAFFGNRDAIDVDNGTTLIEGNVIRSSRDDGIDMGGIKKAYIRRNLIVNSGDKGLSVGEGSDVAAESNIFKQNNVGIAVKGNSKIEIKENLISEGEIGLSIYNKYENKKIDKKMPFSVHPLSGRTELILN